MFKQKIFNLVQNIFHLCKFFKPVLVQFFKSVFVRIFKSIFVQIFKSGLVQFFKSVFVQIFFVSKKWKSFIFNKIFKISRTIRAFNLNFYFIKIDFISIKKVVYFHDSLLAILSVCDILFPMLRFYWRALYSTEPFYKCRKLQESSVGDVVTPPKQTIFSIPTT